MKRISMLLLVMFMFYPSWANGEPYKNLSRRTLVQQALFTIANGCAQAIFAGGITYGILGNLGPEIPGPALIASGIGALGFCYGLGRDSQCRIPRTKRTDLLLQDVSISIPELEEQLILSLESFERTLGIGKSWEPRQFPSRVGALSDRLSWITETDEGAEFLRYLKSDEMGFEQSVECESITAELLDRFRVLDHFDPGEDYRPTSRDKYVAMQKLRDELFRFIGLKYTLWNLWGTIPDRE